MEKETFSKRLKALRKKAGINQSELAYLIGVHETTIRRWEAGNKGSPGMDEIKKLAEALNVTEDELLNGKEESGTWQLYVKVVDEFKQEVIDVSKRIPRVASIQATPEGGFLVLGGDYALWQDDALYKRMKKDMDKLRDTVIKTGVALGGIKA